MNRSSWLVIVLLALAADTLPAQTFPEALAAARRNDPLYAQRQADVQLERLQARQARLSYLPSVGIGYRESDAGTSGWTTDAVLAQPLFDFDRLMQFRQGKPLDQRADASAKAVEQDLSRRVLKSMSDIIRARETLRALNVQIQNLEGQTQRAKRMRELGQGTLTEVSDFEVRLAAARANQLSTNNALHTAERAFILLTGIEPQAERITLESVFPKGALQPLEWYRSGALRDNPTLELARRNTQLAEINVSRARSQYLPTVTGFVSYGKAEGAPGVDDTRIGVNLAVPLNTGYVLSSSRAVVELRRARDAERYAEELVTNETQRLHSQVAYLQREIVLREQVIENAKLAVEGNLKGYQGGVRSNIDVVLAIQNQADAEVNLVNSQMTLLNSYLELEILRGGAL
jgi:protease secretion system outer membrane protein